MNKVIMWLAKEESGQGLVEYALIIALVSVVSFLGLYALRAKQETVFLDIVHKL